MEEQAKVEPQSTEGKEEMKEGGEKEKEITVSEKRRLLLSKRSRQYRAKVLRKDFSTVNPFINRTPMTLLEGLKMTLVGVTLFPLRVATLLPSLAFVHLVCRFCIYGLSDEDLKKRPLVGWRRFFSHTAIRYGARFALFLGGFHYVRTYGKPSKEAPIIVSNHPSSFEPLWYVYTWMPSMVAKEELSHSSLLGPICKAMQSILVQRESATSRKDTADEIQKRATSYYKSRQGQHPQRNRLDSYDSDFADEDDEEDENEKEERTSSSSSDDDDGDDDGKTDNKEEEKEEEDKAPLVEEEEEEAGSGKGVWSPVCLFPEGTCTNGSCLISFKMGAFAPGLPVQPVLIQYPYVHHDLSDVGVSGVWLYFRTMCQFYNRMTVTYLPVYYPNKKEQKNPQLYAYNVRKYMARHLNVPTTEHTFDDVALSLAACKMSKYHFPAEKAIIEAKKLQDDFGEYGQFTREAMLKYLKKFIEMDLDSNGEVSYTEFLSGLELPDNDRSRNLFRQLDVDRSGTLDFREFLTGMAMLAGVDDVEDYIALLRELN